MNGPNDQKKQAHIKRPLNAFFVWSRLLRPKLLEQNPNISNVQVSVLLGKIWNEMSEEQKKPYYEESKRIKQQHRVDYPGWQFQRNPHPPAKHSKNRKYESLMKSSDVGDNALRNNRTYQIPQVIFIPSGQGFWPIAHNSVPETRVPFYTPDDLPNRMQSCPQQLYMGAKSCTQETLGYDRYIPECSMLSAYPYPHPEAEYAQLKPEEVNVPQECLYKSTPFEVTSTQVKYLSNTVVQENSHHNVLGEGGMNSTVSETLSETFEILYNKKTICVQQPEPELFKAQPAVSNEHLCERQSKCDPVVMTTRIDNGREIISLPSILSKTEGMPGTLLHIPEQNGIHFERNYEFESNVNDPGRFENAQLPLSQPRDEIIESTQFLVEDSHLHAQMCNVNMLLDSEGYQSAPVSERTPEEDQPLTVFDTGVGDINSNQPYEEQVHRAAEILQDYKSDIFSDNDFGSLDGNNWLGDLVSGSCSDEAFSASTSNTGNEESINLENLSELSCFQMSSDNSLFDCLIPTCQSCVQIRSQIHLMSESGHRDLAGNTHNGWTLWYDEGENIATVPKSDADAVESLESSVDNFGHVSYDRV